VTTLCIEGRPLGWAERVTLKLIENARARQLKKFNWSRIYNLDLNTIF